MENPSLTQKMYRFFMDRAEDLAYDKDRDWTASELVQEIGESTLDRPLSDALLRVIAQNTGCPIELLRTEFYQQRFRLEKPQSQENVAISLLAFLNDPVYCRLGNPKFHHTERPDFFKRYVEWCKYRKLTPAGKHALYRELAQPEFLALGLRHGANLKGHAVIRGVWVVGTGDDTL